MPEKGGVVMGELETEGAVTGDLETGGGDLETDGVERGGVDEETVVEVFVVE